MTDFKHRHADYEEPIGGIRFNTKGHAMQTWWCRKCGAITECTERRKTAVPNHEWKEPDLHEATPNPKLGDNTTQSDKE